MWLRGGACQTKYAGGTPYGGGKHSKLIQFASGISHNIPIPIILKGGASTLATNSDYHSCIEHRRAYRYLTESVQGKKLAVE